MRVHQRRSFLPLSSCLVLAAFLLALSGAPGWAAGGDLDKGVPPAIALSDFGIKGHLVPGFARELLPVGVFQQPATKALAEGLHYVAFAEAEGVSVPTLRLHNVSAHQSLILISALGVSGETLANFVVHQKAGATMQLRVDIEATSLVVLGLHEFELAWTGSGVAREVRVAVPVQLDLDQDPSLVTRSVNYCQNKGRTVSICNSANECVSAYARRRLVPGDDKFGGQEGRLTVEVGGVNFHCGYDSDPGPGCYQNGYETQRCNGSYIGHEWSGMDDTIFLGIPSYASCSFGCSGFWNIY